MQKPSRLLNIGGAPEPKPLHRLTEQHSKSQRTLESNHGGKIGGGRGISSEHYVFKDFKKRKYLDPHTHMKAYAQFVTKKSSRARKSSSLEKPASSVPSRNSLEKSPNGSINFKKTDSPVLP